MSSDLELYRRDVRVSIQPPIRLSVIDIAPENPENTLMLVHGFGGRASQWAYQLDHFSRSNRVIAVDLRGHGRSDRPSSGYSMDEIQSDLEKVLDTLGVCEPIVLVGHSFGGAVTTEFAAAHPSRVGRLVLIASAGEFRLNPLYRTVLRLPSASLLTLAPLTGRWLGAPPHVLKEMYEHNLATWNGWSMFRDLQVPTLVIRGHLDAVLEKPMFEEVARAIPGAEEIDVGASGHMVMLERREAVNRAIDRFMGSGRRSFSQGQASVDETRHARMVRERPWLGQYDNNVPYTIAAPRALLQDLLHSSARRYPRRTALAFEGSQISYRRLEQEASRFANALRAMGLQKGERVMLALPNLPQLVIALFGILKAGGVAALSPPTATADELLHQLRNSGARTLVLLAQFDALLDGLQAQAMDGEDQLLQHLILTDLGDYLPTYKRLALRWQRRGEEQKPVLNWLPPERQHWFKPLLYSQTYELKAVDTLSQDPAVILYTGGTTDIPRGVALSHRNLVANAIQTRHWMPEAKDGHETVLSVLPFAHSYGLTTGLSVPLALGATIVLKAKFDVEDTLRAIKKYRPTIFPGVPQMYLAIKDFPGVRKYGISSVRACLSGSAPLPVEVQEAFEKLTRGRLVEGYGLTEAGPVTHANPLHGQRKVGSIGIPLPSTQARVVDLRTGKLEVQTGQIGELAVKGPQVMLGYWQAPEATARVLSPDGWLLTGDVAIQDADGYFRIIARKADLWYPERPDQPAFPRDVEEVLYEIPQVKEAAVVAIARQPIAFLITIKERPTAEAVLAYCRRRLPPHLVPRLVLFVDDFPRTFIGKVLRRELARRYREDHEAGRRRA